MLFREPLLLLKLYSLPRRIPEYAGKATLVEDLGEDEVPVEEAVLAGEGFDFGLEVGGEGLALDEVAEVGCCDAGGCSLFLVVSCWQLWVLELAWIGRKGRRRCGGGGLRPDMGDRRRKMGLIRLRLQRRGGVF